MNEENSVSSFPLTTRRPGKRTKRNSFDLNAFLTSVELAALRIAVTVVFLTWIIRHLIQEVWK
jgi:hypothetical protein